MEFYMNAFHKICASREHAKPAIKSLLEALHILCFMFSNNPRLFKVIFGIRLNRSRLEKLIFFLVVFKTSDYPDV